MNVFTFAEFKYIDLDSWFQGHSSSSETLAIIYTISNYCAESKHPKQVINPLLHDNAFLTSWKYHAFENNMENGAFALLEQMFHFP